MTREELNNLIVEWAQQSEVAQQAYVAYLSELKKLESLSRQVGQAIEEEINRPHIEIGDFEIDG